MGLAAWDDEYAKVARAASQLRTTGNLGVGVSRQGQVEAVRSTLQRLLSQLDQLEREDLLALSPGESARRRNLLQHLSQQLNGGTGTSMFGNEASEQQPSTANTQPTQMSATAMALRQQDDMIDDLALGVNRLKHQSNMINEEANMHVRLIEDMDGDVEKAQAGMEAETRRAMKLREDRSVWRLYVIIGVLSVMLVLLILLGLT